MWAVCAEYIASLLWSYTLLVLSVSWVCGLLFDLSFGLPVVPWTPAWPGLVLGITCLLQFAISIFMDRRYDHGLARVYPYIIWYPLFYWTVNWVTSILAFPIAALRRPGTRGLWVTTDRGIRESCLEAVSAERAQDSTEKV